MRIRLIPLAAATLACTLARAQPPPPQPPTTPADLAEGTRTFRPHCAYCHGPRGDGGRGANLAQPKLLHAPDDRAMYNVIENGIPDTEMPGHWLPPRQIWQVVAFVRTLGKTAAGPMRGDAARGRVLYESRGGCARCHTVAGRGGAIGPDLNDIGARRSPAYLRQSLTDPEAAVPEGFLEVRLVTAGGQRITGVRLSEDEFSLQIRDLSDRFHSFWKAELSQLDRQPGKSPMPGYGSVFTAGELDDLVAYLASLGGSH